jgi:hypothetical protein
LTQDGGDIDHRQVGKLSHQTIDEVGLRFDDGQRYGRRMAIRFRICFVYCAFMENEIARVDSDSRGRAA